MEEKLKIKLEKLKEILRSYKPLVIAFSGGVDSTYLLKVAREVLGDEVMAVTAHGPLYPAFETREAEDLAAEFGVKQVFLENTVMSDPAFTANPEDHCYICKRGIFGKLREYALENGFTYVADGTNIDDKGDYRPGMKALAELGIISPLKEAGLGKDEIRELSHEAGIANWDKPSYACLASRIPYGTEITPELLQRIDQAEDLLREMGLKQLRVRHYGDTARIEVPVSDMAVIFAEGIRENILAGFRKLGYVYVSVDLDGYSTGSLNKVL